MKRVDDLAAIIAPPSDPVVSITENDWLQLFARFGTRLPEDFVQFHKRYGDGYFASVSHPRTAGISIYAGGRRFEFEFAVPRRLAELRVAKERSAKTVPAPLYWEPNGLLPWGNTTNGTDLCWRVHGELVDNWTVVALRVASRELEEFNFSMTEFLAAIISGKIVSKLMPGDLPGAKGVEFHPWRFD